MKFSYIQLMSSVLQIKTFVSVFRYTDIADFSERDSNGNKNIVYPNLQVAPFTCYLLPEHFNQLLQHITAPQ